MTDTAVDVAVVGGGPAGIAAAVTAAKHGARVALFDEAPRPGGQIWRHVEREALPAPARTWLSRLDESGVEVSTGASVVDAAGHRLVVQPVAPTRSGAAGPVPVGGPRIVHAKSIILATGARELFLPFPGWTLPGVVGVGGAQALLKAGLSVRGMRVVVAGSGPLLLPVAAALSRSGASVVEVLEQTPLTKLLRFGTGLWRTPTRVAEAAAYRSAFARARFRTGTWVARAEGEHHVTGAVVTAGAETRTIACDMLCVGYGLVPATELARLLGCDADADGVRVDETQRTSVENVYAVGEPTGIGGVDAALVEGRIAGLAATGLAPDRSLLRQRRQHRRFERALAAAFAPRSELRSLAAPDTLICRCEDVPLSSLAACTSGREAKLVTRAGMGPCQGRVCGPAMRHLFGWGPDTVRTPVLPADIRTLLAFDAAANDVRPRVEPMGTS